MIQNLSGKRVALLVANGFTQNEMVFFQKAFVECGAHPRIVSSENGLVNGWDGQEWGHHFAVDDQINSALAADYDLLVVPGGKRSVDKLSLTQHTRRFITGFMQMNKPCCFVNEGVRTLAYTENAEGLSLACDEMIQQDIIEAGGTPNMKKKMIEDGAVLSCNVEPSELQACVMDMVTKLDKLTEETVQQQKAA